MSRAAVRKPPAAKPRFAAPKKAGAKAGGLGVKKMTTKVDDSVFDQAPVEDAPPAAALSALGPTLTVGDTELRTLTVLGSLACLNRGTPAKPQSRPWKHW